MRYIEVKDLTFYYDEEPVLMGVNYHVDEGEFVILTGENGAAKSTLIRSTLGLLTPAKGEVYLAKKNSKGEPLSVGYIPQQISSFNAGFPSTVLELVRSGRYPRGRWFKKLTTRDHEHVQKALESVGMWSYQAGKSNESVWHGCLQPILIYLFSMSQQQGWMNNLGENFIAYCDTVRINIKKRF